MLDVAPEREMDSAIVFAKSTVFLCLSCWTCCEVSGASTVSSEGVAPALLALRFKHVLSGFTPGAPGNPEPLFRLGSSVRPGDEGRSTLSLHTSAVDTESSALLVV